MEKENKENKADGNRSTVKVDFDGETKEFTQSEASLLASKGIRYDMICEDFERIKQIAQNRGCDVAGLISSLENEQENQRKEELLKKCSGDTALVEHILELEKSGNDTDLRFDELKEQFPDIKDISQLPKEVTAAANERGTAVLDEYLRYLHKMELAREEADLSSTLAENSAVGSQADSQMSGYDPTKTEFIKGIWGK